MKKQLLSVALAVVMVVCLVGCGDTVSVNSSPKGNNTSMFVMIETTYDWKIVYHKETKVMYAVSYGDYNRGVFTPLYNADGTLQIYEESDD